MLKYFILLFLPVFAQSQDTLRAPGAAGGYTNINPGAYGTIQNRLAVGRVFSFPTGCSAPDSLWGYDLKIAALYYDSCGHKGYIYDPSLKTWSVVGGGGGGGSLAAPIQFRVNDGALYSPAPGTSSYINPTLSGKNSFLIYRSAIGGYMQKDVDFTFRPDGGFDLIGSSFIDTELFSLSNPM